MVATVARFCIQRRGWMLAACVLLVVAGILTASAGALGHPMAVLPAHLDLWAALRKLLARGPHW